MPEPEGPDARVIDVFILDDQRVLAEALALVISHERGMRVVGIAHDCATAPGLVKQACPLVILLDVGLPDCDGLSLVAVLRQACLPAHILVLTSFSDGPTLLRAIEAGVSGFVSKDRPVTEVITAIRQAAEGEIVIPSSLLLGLLGHTQRLSQKAVAEPASKPLTPRQREVLVLTAQGKSTQTIAKELHLSPLTVRTHLRNLMDKFEVHSRLEAVVYAQRHGLIESPF